MKITMFLCLLILILNGTQAQRLDPEKIAKLPQRQQDEIDAYLQRAKNAKTTALALSIGGGVLAITGLVMFEASYAQYGFDPYNQDNRDDIGAVLFLAGIVTEGISIPFYIKIHKNRNKARDIYFGRPHAGIMPQYSPQMHSAVLKMVIPLGGK